MTSLPDIMNDTGGGYDDTSPGSCFSLDICPDLILAAIAAAAAAGFYLLYITVTMAGRKRKKRSLPVECQNIYNKNVDASDDIEDNDDDDSIFGLSEILSDLLHLGNFIIG